MRANVDDSVVDGGCRVHAFEHLVDRNDLRLSFQCQDGDRSIARCGEQLVVSDHWRRVMRSATFCANPSGDIAGRQFNTGQNTTIFDGVDDPLVDDRRGDFGDAFGDERPYPISRLVEFPSSGIARIPCV